MADDTVQTSDTAETAQTAQTSDTAQASDAAQGAQEVTQVEVPANGMVQASDRASDFVLHADPANVANYSREGDDLVVVMNNGDRAWVQGFFAHGTDFNHLVFANGDQMLYTDFSGALISTDDGINDALVTYYQQTQDDDSGIGLLPILGGLAVAAGAIALVAHAKGGGGSSAPSTPTVSVQDLSQSHHIDAWGVTSAGASVTVTWPDGSSSTAIADTSGNWSVHSPTPELSGNVTVVATDAKGNHSTPTTVYYTDTTVPAAPGNVQVVDTAGDHMPIASGTAAAGSTVTVHWADGTTSIALADSNGNWEAKAGATQGTGEVTANVTDTFGATGPGATFDYTDAATAAITGYTDSVTPLTGDFGSGTATNDTQPQLHGTVAGPILATDVVAVFRDGVLIGTATIDSSGSWTLSDSGLQDGNAYHYTAQVENAAGGAAGTLSADFVVNVITTPPPAPSIGEAIDNVPPITGPIASGKATDDPQPQISGSGAEPNSLINLYDGTTLIGSTTTDGSGNWSLKPDTPLGNGTHDLTATNVDAAGNESAHSADLSFTVNTVPPTNVVTVTGYTDAVAPVTGDFGSGTYTNDTNPTLHGTISGDPLGSDAVVAVYRDQTFIGNATVDSTGTTWSYKDTGGLSDGTYTYTARVESSTGNASTYSSDFTVIIDTTIPSAVPAITSYTDNVGADQGDFGQNTTTDDRRPYLNGTLSQALLPTQHVEIFNGTTPVGSAVVDATGLNWTLQLPSLTTGSTYTYTAAVVTEAGNQGTASSPFAFSVALNVAVTAQTTTDTTPIVTGATGFALETGEHLDVTINNVTYSSTNGAVIVDPQNNTWYVQIPTASALPAGTPANPDVYAVTAAVKSASGQTIANGSGSLSVSNQAFTISVPTPPSADNKAAAMTIGENGQWRLFSNSVVMDSQGTDSTNMATFSNNVLTSDNSSNGYMHAVMATATFIDFNRDGYIDIFGEDSEYIGGQQAFMNMGATPGYAQTNIPGAATSATNTGYYAFQVGEGTAANKTNYGVDFSGSGLGPNGGANTYVYYSAVVAWDKYGTGYVGMVTGDANPNDSAAAGGYNSAFIINHNGIFSKDSDYVQGGALGGTTGTTGLVNQSQPYKEVSAVDLNNSGTVDIVYHGTLASNHLSSSATGDTNLGRLVVVSNSQAATGALSVPQIVDNVFYYSMGAAGGNLTQNGISMTWADFNGDGWLDLYVGATAGGTSGTDPSTAASGKIFFNDGTGQLMASAPNANGINSQPTGAYTLPGNVIASGSTAIDWNCDGKMDIVATPFYPANGTPTSAQAVTLFTNNTSSSATASFSQSTLLTIPLNSVAANNTGTAISGVLAMDVNWDGARDLVVLNGLGGGQIVMNQNVPNYGTSLHFRILDQNGINAFFGNTVQLVDDRTGEVVGTQVLNPQGGVQTNDSSAIVDFYGLNASDTYSVVLLRSVNGVSQDVGGVHTVGANTIENYNAAWGGIAPGEANQCYVLTAEGGTATNDTIGSGSSNQVGIVGTGYNDTFFATLGHNLYEGGGGTTAVSGVQVWSADGGQNVVDYKLAGSTAITVDLSQATEQNTGYDYATFHNIEGVYGGNGNDTFTDSLAGNNLFNGRGGNDTFNLTNGGHDTLLYQVVDANDATGGNGADAVNGWFTGTWEATPKADRIDLSALLIGYTPAKADGPAHYINGVATIDAGDNIANYLSVTHNGNDTTIMIDRDGTGGQFQSTALVTLNNTTADLATLLANHQIVV